MCSQWKFDPTTHDTMGKHSTMELHLTPNQWWRAGCNSEAVHLLSVWWIVGSVPLTGPNELVLIQGVGLVIPMLVPVTHRLKTLLYTGTLMWWMDGWMDGRMGGWCGWVGICGWRDGWMDEWYKYPHPEKDTHRQLVS